MKKIKFRIPNNLMGSCAFSQKEYCKLLYEVFDFKPHTLKKMIDQCDGRHKYTTIVCTAEEFALFLIERSQKGLTNGFLDIKAEVYGCSENDGLARAIAEKANVCDISVVKRVMDVLCKNGMDVDSLLSDYYIHYTDEAKDK